MKRIWQIWLLIIFATVTVKAQYIEDALRYAVPNGMITPRVAAFNVAYHGLSDDIGALNYNPAGLTIPEFGEFSIGLGFTRNKVETDFLGVKDPLGSNSEYLTHIGFNVPFQMGEHKAALAVGYFMETNFDKDIRYGAFNPYNSYISTNNDMAQFLWLADSAHYTPIINSLQQNSFIQESGGLHNITGAIAYDISKYLSVGFGLAGKWGTFSYTKEYTESDVNNVYKTLDTLNFKDVDFKSLTVNETINADISGFSASLGIQSRISDFMRIGASIKLPTWYEINETFSQTASAEFDNGDKTKTPYDNSGQTSYSIRTPFVYSAGLSFHKFGLTLTTGIEYTDVSQLEFGEATPEIQKLNLLIVQNLVGQLSWGVGAEYQIPMVPILIRGSYSQITSPYAVDIPNSNLYIASFGAGIYVGSNIRLDAVCRLKGVSEQRTNYSIQGSTNSFSNGTEYSFTSKPIDFGLGFTYRY